MLQEEKNIKQIPGESFRRWFHDKTLDLIVWYSQEKNIAGFQLCYQNESEERVLTWLTGKGFCHNRIDDGEGRPDRHKMSPILVPDGKFDRDHILALFEKESREIDPGVKQVVTQTIKKYPLL